MAYSAAKGGVVNLTKSTGNAYTAQAISVNYVCPGVINTQLVHETEKENWSGSIFAESENYRKLHPVYRIGEDCRSREAGGTVP